MDDVARCPWCEPPGTTHPIQIRALKHRSDLLAAFYCPTAQVRIIQPIRWAHPDPTS